MGRTKDELFLLTLFKLASAKEDQYAEIDRYAVGGTIGLGSKVVDNIVKLLAQANFVKKGDENAIFLTDHGLALVRQLLGT
jgi:hypothetical protein